MKWDDEHMLTTEKVAYWYFRLNGFFQTENFIVHPIEKRGAQRTDADLLGIRFPFRAERGVGKDRPPMKDDKPGLGLLDRVTEIVIVEVKMNEPCTLNGPWSNEERRNVELVLAAMGYFEEKRLADIASCIYKDGQFAEDGVRVRMVAIGGSKNEDLGTKFPYVVQLTWADVLWFIGDRLFKYRATKTDIQQWDDQIKLMLEVMGHHKANGEFDHNGFIQACSGILGIK